MNNISFISFIVLIIITVLTIIVYLCIHSLVDRICTCIERTAAFKCERGANKNKNIEIKQTEELQESER